MANQQPQKKLNDYSELHAENKDPRAIKQSITKKAIDYFNGYIDKLKLADRTKKSLRNFVKKTARLKMKNGKSKVWMNANKFKIISERLSKHINKAEESKYDARVNVAVEKEVYNQYLSKNNKKLGNKRNIIMVNGVEYVKISNKIQITETAKYIKKWFGKFIRGRDIEFDEFIENLTKDQDKKLFANLASIIPHCVLWLDNIFEVGQNQELTNYKDIKAYNDDAPILSHSFLSYEVNQDGKQWNNLFSEKVKTEYIANNKINYACWLTAIIDTYKTAWDKRYKNKLTYEYLYEMLRNEKYTDDADKGFTINEISLFFVENKIAVYIYNSHGVLMFKHDPRDNNENLNTHLYPKISYFLFDGKHIYPFSAEAKLKMDNRKDKTFLTNASFPTDKFNYSVNEKDNQTIIINSEEELLNLIKNHEVDEEDEFIDVLYQADLLKLFQNMVNNGYKPNIKMNSNKLSSLLLHNLVNTSGRFNVKVREITSDHLNNVYFESSEEYIKFVNADNKFASNILAKRYKSIYNEQTKKMLNTYIRGGARWSYESKNYLTVDDDLNSIIENPENIGYLLDFSKYYTYCLLNMPEIPKISSFDNFIDYDGHNLEDMTIYFIHTSKYTTYFDNIHNLCYGFNLKQYDGEYKIIAYLRPYNTFPNKISEAVKELSDNNDLDEAQKKFILNKNIGLAGKKTNGKSIISVLKNKKEAKINQTLLKSVYGTEGTIRELLLEEEEQQEAILNLCMDDEFKNSDEKEDVFNLNVELTKKLNKIWIHEILLEKELTEGFYPIKLFILDMARLKLYKLEKDLKQLGCEIMAVNTDCVYVDDKINKDKLRKLINKKYNLKDGKKSFFENIGSLKVEEIKDMPNWRTFQGKPNKNLYVSYKYNEPLKIDIEDEFNKDEMKEKITKDDKLIMLANVPGAGKTTAFINSLDKEKTLFISPYNKLVQELKKKGNKGITYNILFGFHKDENIKFQEFDLDNYDNIVFDEIFLYSVNQLEHIRELMIKKDKIKFYATGDEYQLEPIEEPQTKQYMRNAIFSLFNKAIILNINKRCRNKKQQARIQSLCKRIRNAKTKEQALDIIIKNFKTIHNKKDVETKKAICYYNNTCKYVDKLIHGTDIIPSVGQSWICREGARYNNIRSFVNYSYDIIEIKNKIVKLSDGDSYLLVPIEDFENKFKIDYSRTAHSLQGLSIDEPVTIFDIYSEHVNINWLYVAITRSTDLDKITICTERPKYVKEEESVITMIKKKIEGHIRADKENNRPLDNYVTINWVVSEIKKNNYMCPFCGCEFTKGQNNFSIDRIDNNKGHSIDNCQVICVNCNIRKK